MDTSYIVAQYKLPSKAVYRLCCNKKYLCASPALGWPSSEKGHYLLGMASNTINTAFSIMNKPLHGSHQATHIRYHILTNWPHTRRNTVCGFKIILGQEQIPLSAGRLLSPLFRKYNVIFNVHIVLPAVRLHSIMYRHTIPSATHPIHITHEQRNCGCGPKKCAYAS